MEELGCRYEKPANLDIADIKAQNREDFMKRWFAIALSVGFATALSRMPWIANQRILIFSLPVDWHQVNQGMRLVAAGTATLLSWEGYLLSIDTKPLRDGKRFYVDVLLVTLYLILLLTSSSQQLWIAIHAITFFIYVAWDFMSIRAYPETYIKNNHESYKTRAEIYRGIMRGSRDIRHGPIVTLLWPIYLGTLVGTYYGFFDAGQRASFGVTTLYFVLVGFGLFSYRSAKSDHESSLKNRIVRILSYSLAASLLAFLLHLFC